MYEEDDTAAILRNKDIENTNHHTIFPIVEIYFLYVYGNSYYCDFII